jgi:hypothetical protein
MPRSGWKGGRSKKSWFSFDLSVCWLFGRHKFPNRIEVCAANLKRVC